MNDRDPPNVGAYVHTLRQQRGLSLRALAELCELSPNTISLIERGASSPSVATLHRLATALGVPITAFFEKRPEPMEIILTRAGERVSSGSASVLLESLGFGLVDQRLGCFLVKLKPGAGSGEHVMVHEGHELVYCLSGEVEYKIGSERYRLAAGDSLLFEAKLPHHWRNSNVKPAVFLLILESTARGELVEQHLHP